MLHAHPRAAVAIPLPKRIARDTRAAMEAAIEQHLTAVEGLLALLDVFDGDADLEPSLGGDPADQSHWALGDLQDREADVHDEPHDAQDEGNDEPSLGAQNPHPLLKQTGWAEHGEHD